MSIEINDHIISRLLLRELGFTVLPVRHDGSLTEIDVEDSFIKVEDDLEFLPTQIPNPDTEPE